VIRELAENPNVHQPLSPGRELHVDARGRFAIYLSPGTVPEAATVQRVRLAADAVEQALSEIRALLRARRREGAEWELGESSTPADLVERLLALGLLRIDADPVTIGMTLRSRPVWEPPPGVTARRVADVGELVRAREVQHEAFGDARPVDVRQAERDFAREGIDGSTFLAWVDGEPVAAGYAAYTEHGLILFGGATLPAARGRGAYRALVVARADEAASRGTPALVTHAGRMSRPILERLGFEPVARIDRLIDVM
jgi:GNAT superfamily N-acetyltransferase